MLFNTLLALHIAGGSVALVSGPVPMLAAKGGRLHRRAGDVYAVAMTIGALSAVVLAAVIGNLLLLVIGVFTAFLLFCGVRAIGFLRGARRSLADDAVCVLTLAFSLWLLWFGWLSASVTALFFGAAGSVLGIQQLRRLRRPAPDWLASHLTSMGGAYIATFTAFLVVNFQALNSAVAFIGPTLAGTVLLSWARFRVSAGRVTAVPPAPPATAAPTASCHRA